MKQPFLFLLTILITTLTTTQTLKAENPEQPGVSRELAEWRSRNITHLEYNLSFQLPESTDEAVTGTETLSFNLNKKQAVVIDFKANAEQLQSVDVNGTRCTATVKDEHIVIPASALRKGQNNINISFVAGNQSLNRHAEFLYTLLVPDRARTLFPCFDQPDLKAQYRLTLSLPESWVAVSNTMVATEECRDGRKRIAFAPTEPLSTYLFSFVAGKFQQATRTRNGRTISAYHRENDADKIAQLDTLFDQVFCALDWLETYTGIPYPFAKYDFVILPGFQFGGMEHTGATLYNDRLLFLGNNPTADEILDRAQLIAHETAHMWFGDLVTMKWFDDVWTKEVFANYYAAEVTEPLYPNINHRLNWMRTFYTSSLNEDRTDGTTAIQQPLDNLQDAGLIYGRIIYNKAPIMMRNLVNIMGKDLFRQGIQTYLRRFAYANATWDDLIEILDELTEKDLKAFSQAWVKEKGMPALTFRTDGNQLRVAQTDPFGRGIQWQQRFQMIARDESHCDTLDIRMDADTVCVSLPFVPTLVIPNSDGRGYGFFRLDEPNFRKLTQALPDISSDVTRQALIMTLYENYAQGEPCDTLSLVDAFLKTLSTENNELIASSLISKIASICFFLDGAPRSAAELHLEDLSQSHARPSARLQLQRQLMRMMTEPSVVQHVYDTFTRRDNALWNENDYTTAAYELAIRYPERATDILAAQRATLSNPDRIAAFDYCSRACATSDTTQLDALFRSLLVAENRRIEPQAETLLYYLNHPLRDAYSAKYILPGLEALRQVQLTGDIFFPRFWCEMLLSPHRSPEAAHALQRFLDEHPDYPQLLKNKILQAVPKRQKENKYEE